MTQPPAKVKDLSLFRLPALEAVDGLSCTWVGRGPVLRPDPAALLASMSDGAPVPPLATVSQIHSARWVRARPPAGGRHAVLGEADAMVTSDAGLALGIATADCVPVVAVEPRTRALAVAHAGWRGTLAGVVRSTLEAMKSELGARAERILVGMGPSAGACCYRVGEEVADGFAAARGEGGVVVRRDGAVWLDLIEENRLQAAEAGVAPDRIHALGVCTVCRPDVCHSYRRDGSRAGRMWLLAFFE